MNKRKHILYNYRRCPYAMRARMALVRAGIPFDVIDVDFKNKPDHMIEISPKGTVPVLFLNDDSVIDESLDIVQWACGDEWAQANHDLISQNDGYFKSALDRYKYPSRFENEDCSGAREAGQEFIKILNDCVSLDDLTLTDICIFPFVRQFANVDRAWFDNLPYAHVHQWLDFCLQSNVFQQVMDKNFKGL